MGVIEKFEDIVAWQKGMELCKLTYSITNADTFKQDYGLKDQMRRAWVSIVSNIAEGFERSSDKDFARFLYMAKGSDGELRTQLYIAKEVGNIGGSEFDRTLNLVKETSRLLSKFISYLSK